MKRKIKYLKYLLKQIQLFLEKENLPYHKKVDTSLGSQKGQIEYLLNNFFNYENNGLKKKGYFVDLACADGIQYSNTYFLEKYLDWKGLLIEPNPKFKESIIKNRTSTYVNECIGRNNTDIVRFRIDNFMFGGIVGDAYDNNKKFRKKELDNAEIISLKTKTLETILDEFKCPEIIDYLNLDVEGAEEEVLLNFNFKKYKFKFMSIERPTVNLDIKLELENYIQILHAGNDVYYSHRDFVDEINQNPSFLFKLTPQKEW